MLKSFIAATAAAALMSIAACSQGPNEEAGEAADTAMEQSSTGSTDMGQGPMEEQGEQTDAVTGGVPANPTVPADGSTTTPPATTP